MEAALLGRRWPRRSARSLLACARAAAAALCLLCLAGPAEAASVSEFPLPVADSHPFRIAAGPDGNLWFTEFSGNRIGRIKPSGRIDDWSTGSGISNDSFPIDIAAGPDGNLWFTEQERNRIGRMSPVQLTATEFTMGINGGPRGIAAGPDGNLWFTETYGSRIGRITPAGAVTEYSFGISPSSSPNAIAAGPDGNLWFTEYNGNRIGRITPAGTVTESSLGISPYGAPDGIVAGPDGNLWFTEAAGRVGRITTAGGVTEYSAGISPHPLLNGIALGPDGNLWFTEAAGRVGRITPAGGVTEYSAGISPNSQPEWIALGPDGNMWFTENAGNRIGRLILDPAVTTGNASSIAGTGARLSGTVTPFGSRTSYAFQYGRTTAYGLATDSQILAPGGKPVAVSARVGGLQPRRLYHYRLVASSAAGTSFGSDRAFTTADAGGRSGGSPRRSRRRRGPRMRILSRALILTKTGLVRISLRCPLTETLGCHGTVSLQTAGKPRLRLGRARFRIGGGQTRTVKIRLLRRGRALVRRLHRLRVRAIVTGSSAAGNRRTIVKRLSLRSRKR